MCDRIFSLTGHFKILECEWDHVMYILPIVIRKERVHDGMKQAQAGNSMRHLRDFRTGVLDRQTDGPMDGWTDPLIEMRWRILKWTITSRATVFFTTHTYFFILSSADAIVVAIVIGEIAKPLLPCLDERQRSLKRPVALLWMFLAWTNETFECFRCIFFRRHFCQFNSDSKGHPVGIFTMLDLYLLSLLYVDG